MEPDTVNLEQAMIGLGVMSAIPVVLLGLWSDYFERRIEQQVMEDPEVDGAIELERVKMASLCALVSQVLLFLGASDLRDAYPVLSPFVFVVSVSLQIWIQSKSENKVHEKMGVKSKATENLIGISLRATFCWVVGIALHLFLLGLAAGVTSLLIEKYQPTFLVGTLALSATGILALVAGLVLNTAFSPWYFKFIFPLRSMSVNTFRTRIESCFLKFGMLPPDIWILELNVLKITQNILVGFRRGSGKLKQALFLSSLVLSVLSETEVEALTLNQVSHIILKHPKKRGFLILLLVTVTTALAVVSVVLGQRLAVDEFKAEVLGAIAALVVFAGTFRILFLQNQLHEAEGDLYSVVNMGVSVEVLSSAWRKLDLLVDPIPLDIATVAKIPVGFPETEIRIQSLKNALAKMRDESTPDLSQAA